VRKLILDGDHRSDGRYLEIGATSGPEGATLDCECHRPVVLVRLLWQRLVPMCPGIIKERAMRSEQSDWPSAWPRPYGLEPAPARTSTARAAVVNGSDVPPDLERAVVCSGGRIVRNRLITAPGSDPAPRAPYLRASTEHPGHPEAASTAACSRRLLRPSPRRHPSPASSVPRNRSATCRHATSCAQLHSAHSAARRAVWSYAPGFDATRRPGQPPPPSW
jgi:hypothetical protein